MYNRYTPSPDGTFQRTVVPDAPPPKPPEPEVCALSAGPTPAKTSAARH